MSSTPAAVGDTPDPLATDDPVAWERLIVAVGIPSLLVFVRSRLGAKLAHRVTDEDVLQEALLHAWRDRRSCQWRGLRAFRRWLLQIIENRIRKLADEAATERRGGRKVTLAFSAIEPSRGAADGSVAGLASRIGLAAGGTPSRSAVHHEEAAAIDEALASLPDELRDVVRLRLIEELEMEEVASRAGIGISAAYHRLRKGMELYRIRLRERLVDRSRRGPPSAAPDVGSR